MGSTSSNGIISLDGIIALNSIINFHACVNSTGAPELCLCKCKFSVQSLSNASIDVRARFSYTTREPFSR
jgi:hypothetical protein